MKKAFNILICYAIIPFLASMVGLGCALGGLYAVVPIMVPLLTIVFYLLLRKKLNIEFASSVNGVIFLALIIVFTIMMIIASGSIEGVFMSQFIWLILPLGPAILVLSLVGQNADIFLTALFTYGAAAIITMLISKRRMRRVYLPLAAVVICMLADGYLYMNRPAAKYGGHGFDYMHGYSSTDFSDYMVYSEKSRLVTLDHESEFQITEESEMPVMDGAEACYPLYAAYAKAVYKDIDKIEKNWLETTDNPYRNGKIVAFTNTIQGLDRLILGCRYEENRVDLFFGARPSEEQLQMAEEEGIELEITPIGREAFVFFVENDNPIEDLTVEQIKAIYHGDITNWKELGGKDQEILAFQRPAGSGSQTMMQYFMGDVSLKEPKTYEMVSAMEGVIRKVAQYANEEGAIGYSFRYFLEGLHQEKDVKMLSVNGVYPSIQTIEDGSYPLTTNVCLITRKDDQNPNVQKMIEYILSEDGQEILRETGYAGIQG